MLEPVQLRLPGFSALYRYKNSVWHPPLHNFRCGINFVVNSRELRKYFKCLKTEFSIIFVYIPAILCYHIFEA